MTVNRIAQHLLSAYRNQIASLGAQAPTPGARPARGAPPSGAPASSDDVALSEGVRTIQRIQRHIASLPDVREETVARLQEQVRTQSYQVAVQQLARRLLSA